MGRELWKRGRREAKGVSEGGGGGCAERMRDREAGGEVYTLLTTTSSHVPSFLGTYYSEAL